MARRGSLIAPPASGWRWALLGGLLGLLVACTFYAPARWLAGALSNWSGGYLQLVNPRGTVWNGSASVVLASGASGAEALSLPGPLSWRLRPTWSGVSAALDLPCCAAQPLALQARLLGSGVQLDWRDGQSHWPAAMLSGFGAPWNTLKPEGTLNLSTQALSLRWNGPQLAIAGAATLDANDISSSLSTLRPMGSYRIALQGGARPTLLVTTREGSLQLSGSGFWTGRALRFNGEASAAPGREDALSNLLNIIGRRDGKRSLITLG